MDSPFVIMLFIFAVFGTLNAVIAHLKGFSPFLWFFAAGLLGLIVVSVLPSANKVVNDTEEYEKRRKKSNQWGYGILIFAAVMIIIRFISALA